ncbi:hypothetical protein H6F86_25500 [Phormidium sp. FACHB-592]|uniref:Bacteriocin n=1 Tax=Stenomitos frigidus AS-A4 TaxID=2933935 RepID=A0ABV0KVE9_9CYAN|nr:hypothetical protein [Phormidium sp. FACHB-592]MBD2077176.1 hypothetical protein [Phormidium sp. FACHB-592]
MDNFEEQKSVVLNDQASDELSFEELEAINGAGLIDDIGNGIGQAARAVGKGIADLSQIPGRVGRELGRGYREGLRD